MLSGSRAGSPKPAEKAPTEDEPAGHLTKVYQSLPAERLTPYFEECGQNLDRTLGLYAWNTLASGAIYECLSHFEISIRNALDAVLKSRHAYHHRAGDWLDNRHSEFSENASTTLANARFDAKSKLKGEGSPPRGAIIAELSFGFWRRLLDERYERHWGTAVMRFFPELKRARASDMKTIRDLVEPIYSLRNRVAHHEPIWKISITNREADMLRIIKLIDADTAVWVAARSRVLAVVASRDTGLGPGYDRTA
ncbi:Abi family protein [Cryobacterium sp. M25]|uniref:Abi family protein n=1 Tax=Cryobacterium sp. M25 TaxID=2048293 RepID=UPI001E360846|nr:Abi family protein [Cryobacterium sp. M25]